MGFALYEYWTAIVLSDDIELWSGTRGLKVCPDNISIGPQYLPRHCSQKHSRAWLQFVFQKYSISLKRLRFVARLYQQWRVAHHHALPTFIVYRVKSQIDMQPVLFRGYKSNQPPMPCLQIKCNWLICLQRFVYKRLTRSVKDVFLLTSIIFLLVRDSCGSLYSVYFSSTLSMSVLAYWYSCQTLR